jgi:hypothetical protein
LSNGEKRTPMRVTAERARQIRETDHDALTKRRDAGRGPAVPARIKHAVELLLKLGAEPDYAKIATEVGYRSTAEFMRWFRKPQSVKYLKEQKRSYLESVNAGNPEALRRVRDESQNSMAKVQAVRTLESMGDRMDEANGARAGHQAPGITIVIEHPGQPDRYVGPQLPTLPAGPVIDLRPDNLSHLDDTAP